MEQLQWMLLTVGKSFLVLVMMTFVEKQKTIVQKHAVKKFEKVNEPKFFIIILFLLK